MMFWQSGGMGGKIQDELIVMCHMVGKTVQVAIDNLNYQGLVIERNSLDDTRKKGIIADSVGLTVIG